MKKINDLTMRELENLNDRKWYSHIKNLVDNVDTGFGNLDISLTIKNSQVTNIKVRSEASFSVHNGK